jgi:hypothetical protein
MENKTGKYLKYAIGEIILVVIGILIALQVNNWNQEVKDQRLGEDLLHRIHRDLVQDTTNFSSIITRNNALREEIKGLLVTMYDGVSSVEQVQEMSLVYDKALDQTFTPNDNTYRSMLSSGTLGLIEDQELKEEIMDHYAHYDQSGALLSSIGDWMVGVASTVDSETDFIKFGDDVIDIFTTEEMLNESDYAFLNDKEDRRFKLLVRAISAAAFNQKVNITFYEDLIDRCHLLLERLEQELNQEP